jgi:hypothetical protein
MNTIVIRAGRKIVMLEYLQIHQFGDQRSEKQGDKNSRHGQAPVEQDPFRFMVF